jgi:outer membrane protein
LNLSAGPSLRFGRSFDQTTAGLTEQQSRALSLNASSSVNLFNGFADMASIREAGLGLGASENSFKRARQRILSQTASQYLQIFLNEEHIQVEEENLNAQQQQLESIQAGYEAGNRPIADVLQQQTSIAQTEQRLIAARRDYELSVLHLKQTLHLSPFSEVAFESPAEGLFVLAPMTYDANILVVQAIKAREDVTAQRLRIEAAEAGISVARSGYYPSISLNASTGTNYSSQNNQFGFGD